MERHPYFDLLLHSGAELEALFGSSLTERHTLHEWPLSCVQRLRFADGRHWIYKAACGPTIEPEFYAAARSRLLPGFQVLYRDAQYACMLIEDLPFPTLDESRPSEQEICRIGKDLLWQIAEIEGSPPVFLDLHTFDQWEAAAGKLVEDLHRLVQSEKYLAVNQAAVQMVAQRAASPAVRKLYEGSVGLVHGDLSGDNVFSASQGYSIIDWQRPMLALTEVDYVYWLDSMDLDPLQLVGPGAVIMADMLKIQWFVECTLRWFPPGCDTYDQTITQIIANRLAACG